MDEAPGAKRPVRLQIQRVETRRHQWTFEASQNKTDAIEKPSIWTELREQANEYVPRYRGEHGLTFTPSPVVVSGPAFDTVAGFGIAGDF